DFVRTQLALGATSIKIYSALPPPALRGIVRQAHRSGAHVAGDLGAGLSCAEAAEIGIDTIEHAFNSCKKDLPSRLDRENPFRMEEHLEAVDALIAVLVESGTVLVTTPSGGRRADYSESSLELLAPHMREAIERIDLAGGQRSESGNPLYVLTQKDEARKLEKRFVDAGGRLLMGADAMYLPIIPGTANHDVMIELADHHAPLDIIRMATSDAAQFLGVEDETGRVAEGLAADLVIINGRPDQDMNDIRNVTLVFREGRAFDPEKLRAAAVGRIGLD
ncbi:MAG: amidohydrolase family protein, partial [Pseudomonadota bacterium]